MKKEKEMVGIRADQMTLAQLKKLCKENSLDIEGLKTSIEILAVVSVWEESMLEKTKKEVAKRGATMTTKAASKLSNALSESSTSLRFHEGKMVTGSKKVTLNGVEYEDVTVEGGLTYRI